MQLIHLYSVIDLNCIRECLGTWGLSNALQGIKARLSRIRILAETSAGQRQASRAQQTSIHSLKSALAVPSGLAARCLLRCLNCGLNLQLLHHPTGMPFVWHGPSAHCPVAVFG